MMRDALTFVKVRVTLVEFTSVNCSSLPLAEPTWADLTRLALSSVWQSSMKQAQKLEKKKEKSSKVLNPKTIKACLSQTSLSFIPQLSSDPLFCCLLLQSLSLALLVYVFLIYPLLLQPPLPPPHYPCSCPVRGPLCHGNPLFPPRPIINAHRHEHRWNESVCFSSLSIYRTVKDLCRTIGVKEKIGSIKSQQKSTKIY